MYLYLSLEFLTYKNYSSAAEFLDQPINLTQFPSSYFLQSHEYAQLFTKTSVTPLCISDQGEEEMIFDLVDDEKDNRIKYQYLYNYKGERHYSMHEGYLHEDRKTEKKDCMWKYYKGKCHIIQMQDDWYHKGHVLVNFEFVPQIAKQIASDLNESMEIDFYTPSYDFVVENGIQVGNVYDCDKRKKLKGQHCNDHDFDFYEFEKSAEKKDRLRN